MSSTTMRIIHLPFEEVMFRILAKCGLDDGAPVLVVIGDSEPIPTSWPLGGA